MDVANKYEKVLLITMSFRPIDLIFATHLKNMKKKLYLLIFSMGYFRISWKDLHLLVSS